MPDNRKPTAFAVMGLIALLVIGAEIFDRIDDVASDASQAQELAEDARAAASDAQDAADEAQDAAETAQAAAQASAYRPSYGY